MQVDHVEKNRWPEGLVPRFEDAALLQELEAARIGDFDQFDFGVITTDRRGLVIGYNADESARSGLRPERVLGRDRFVDVAPCTNNDMVAERYWSREALDEQLDYVFTFRMRPTPVRLRLLKAAASGRQYLVVRSR